MKETNIDVPTHESLQVKAVTDLYRTGEWWKAVVTYQFEGNTDVDETAVYLWHQDDEGWSRKNKYVVKTLEAWETDRELIDQYIRSDPPSNTTEEFPASDYYTIATGETVFQNDGWWKAIVNVVEKGSYETNEVMVYLWQKRDGEWRRRQKYAIKSVSDWEEGRDTIDEHMALKKSTNENVDKSTNENVDIEKGVSAELDDLGEELESHLSGEYL